MNFILAADFDVFKGLKEYFVSTCPEHFQQNTADRKAMETESYRFSYAVISKWLFRGTQWDSWTDHPVQRFLHRLYLHIGNVCFKRSSEIFFTVSKHVAQWQPVCIPCMRSWIHAAMGKYKYSVLVIAFSIDEELSINSS